MSAPVGRESRLKKVDLPVLAWGAYLCFIKSERRSGRDRRGAGRGGRRLPDAR